MNSVIRNQLNPPVFEIPDPPHEFGQDGGKFYRCYDALAQEIDDDMTSGLKEQLDGVNTAFLALTVPLLSADPADDTNALLAQNNAILMQLVTGRNDTVPPDSILPSTSGKPESSAYAAPRRTEPPETPRNPCQRLRGVSAWRGCLQLEND
ncbi:hypothetical protein M407DRAFT_32593 [Tulasnella calospora MUT 4182]|uniref:Uncharacterized protein n=1 Tax=Tulasnella calospora MUT 4182 TaxID=1051891 RepID=A0A0C3L877_9AGAM|nr:hypothetical protein M407DRAFT_32593 [Tulasnella calospora MUT 4182]